MRRNETVGAASNGEIEDVREAARRDTLQIANSYASLTRKSEVIS
jgi:hypothetical protein